MARPAQACQHDSASRVRAGRARSWRDHRTGTRAWPPLISEPIARPHKYRDRQGRFDTRPGHLRHGRRAAPAHSRYGGSIRGAADEDSSDAAAAARFLAGRVTSGGPRCEWYGDSAYGTGDLRAAISQAGHTAGDQAQATQTSVAGRFTIDDITSMWRRIAFHPRPGDLAWFDADPVSRADPSRVWAIAQAGRSRHGW